MGRKWEEKYNQYLSGEMDSKYQELKEKMKNENATIEEYNEFQAIDKIKSNIPKVENILELRNKLQEQLNETKAEIARIQTLKNANQEEKNLEDEMNKITTDMARIEKELKRTDLSKEDSEKLRKEYSDLQSKRNDNNSKYQDVQKVFAENSKSNNKLSQMSIEELNKKSFELSTKISKCNMVANNMMKGLSWDAIEVNLDNWKSRKFTSKEKLNEKLNSKGQETNFEDLEEKIIKETERQINEETNRSPKTDDTEMGDTGIDDDEIIDEIEDLPVLNFDERHPRLAKIKNWFKEKFSKIKDFIVMDEEGLKKDDKDNNNDEATKEVDNEFKKYLKEVAEKGMYGIELEKQKKKLESQIEARKRQDKYKKEAHARETEKFGKEYADMSYKVEDEGR